MDRGGKVSAANANAWLRDPALQAVFDPRNFGEIEPRNLLRVSRATTTAAGFRNIILTDLGGMQAQSYFVGTLRYTDGKLAFAECHLPTVLAQLPGLTGLDPLTEARFAVYWVEIEESLLFGASLAEWINTSQAQRHSGLKHSLCLPCFVFRCPVRDVASHCEGCATKDVVPALRAALNGLPALIFTTAPADPKQPPVATGGDGTSTLVHNALRHAYGARAHKFTAVGHGGSLQARAQHESAIAKAIASAAGNTASDSPDAPELLRVLAAVTYDVSQLSLSLPEGQHVGPTRLP